MPVSAYMCRSSKEARSHQDSDIVESRDQSSRRGTYANIMIYAFGSTIIRCWVQQCHCPSLFDGTVHQHLCLYSLTSASTVQPVGLYWCLKHDHEEARPNQVFPYRGYQSFFRPPKKIITPPQNTAHQGHNESPASAHLRPFFCRRPKGKSDGFPSQPKVFSASTKHHISQYSPFVIKFAGISWSHSFVICSSSFLPQSSQPKRGKLFSLLPALG